MTNQQIGHRGEELVENYIRHNLIPTLQNKDAWTDIIIRVHGSNQLIHQPILRLS
jgi:hypothetical protein